ncbi:SGNH/GDSL hydrolase family protein [[Mycoplasma] gypis]|uniref:SGNH/GDSL hydrolase family protein n=1 Tax=[Mycoplasma] gypis TaxID=92404 RepID=A0ABZ2RRE9_9BACT|nr:SGNH/GDSL hydrolase family protein [[Mycoplasma] gypis]MBN0919267.1 hypothetical protein [[Mycoplasma] gypis]
MTKKSIIAISSALAIATVLAVSIPVSVVMSNKNKAPQNEEPILTQNDDVIRGAVNYVAIGDSIAAGFNTEFGYDQGGFLNPVTNEVEGLSYSSYIANAIKMANDSQTHLTSFYNFGLTGSTLDEWIYLLDPQNYTNPEMLKKVKSFLTFDSNIDKAKNNPIRIEGKRRIEYLFNDFEPKNNEMGILTQQLKKANLMTISLGANDFIARVDIANFLSALALDSQTAGPKLQKYYDDFLEQAKNAANVIVEKYQTLISMIRAINPDIKINLISYPLPFLRLAPLIDKKFASITPNVSDQLLAFLNNSIKKAAKQNEVNYINTYDDSFWTQHSKILAGNIFDIHPDFLGYKKMAQDIFLKMSINPDAKGADLNFDEEYAKSDKNSYKQILGFKDYTNASLKTLIWGVQGINVSAIENAYPFENNPYNTLIKNFLVKNPDIPVDILIKNYTHSESMIYERDHFLNLIEKFAKGAGIDWNNLKNLKKFVDDLVQNDEQKEFIPQLINAFVDTGYINKIFNAIKNDIDELLDTNNIDAIDISKVSDIFKKNLLSTDILYQTIRSFLSSDFVQQNKNSQRLKQLIQAVIKDFLNADLIKVFVAPKYHKIIDGLAKDPNIFNLTSDMLLNITEDLINNKDFYFKESNTFSSFQIKVWNKFKDLIKENIKIILKRLLSDDNFVELDKEIIINFLEKTFNEKLNDSQKYDLGYIITSFIKSQPQKPYFDGLIDFILDEYFKEVEKPDFEIKNFLKQLITKVLLVPYKGNEHNEVIFSIINDIANNEKYLKGFKTIVNTIFSKNLLDGISFTATSSTSFAIDKENIKSLIVNIFNSDIIAKNNNVKEMIKYVFAMFMDSSVFNNQLIPEFLSIYAQGNISNKIYALMNKAGLANDLNRVFLSEGGLLSAINKWFNAFVKDMLKNPELRQALKQTFFNFIDNIGTFKADSIEQIAINIVKNIKVLNPSSLVEKLLQAVNSDSESRTLGLNLFYKSVESFAGITLSEEQKTLLATNIKKVLNNFVNTDLYKDFLNLVSNDINSVTLKEFGDNLLASLKQYFEADKVVILNKILAVLFAKPSGQNIQIQLHDWIKALQPIVQSQKLEKLIFDTFSLKQNLIKALNSFNPESINDQEVKKQLQTVVQRFSFIIETKFDNIVRPFIHELIDKIFGQASLNASKQGGKHWFNNYLKNELKTLFSSLIKQLTQIINNDSTLKPGILNLASSFIEQIIKKYFVINDKQQQVINDIVSKILNALTNEKLLNETANKLIEQVISLFSIDDNIQITNLSIDINNLNLKSFGIDIAINNLEKILNVITGPETIELLNIFNQNKEQIIDLLDNSYSSSSSSFDKNVIIRIVLQTIKIINSKLSPNEELKRQADEKIQSIVNFIASNSKVKKLLNDFIVKTLSSLPIEKNQIIKMVDFVVNDLIASSDTKQLFTKIIDSLLLENTQKVQSLNSILDLVKYIALENKANIEKFIVDNYKKTISNQTIRTIFKDIIKKEILKTSPQTDNENLEQIISLVDEIIDKISEFDAFDKVVSHVLDNFEQLKAKNNNDISTFKWSSLISNLDIKEILSKEDIQKIIEILFKENKNDKLIALFKAFKPLIFNLINRKPTASSTVNEEQNTQNSVLDLFKMFVNLLKDSDNSEQIIQNIAEFIVIALKDVTQNDLDKINKLNKLTDLQKDVLKDAFTNVLENEKTTNLIKSVLIDILRSQKLENVQNFADILNYIVKTQSDLSFEIAKDLLNHEVVNPQKLNIVKLIVDFIEKQKAISMNETQRQSFEGIVSRLLDTIPELQSKENTIARIKKHLKAKDLFTSNLEINQELIEVIKDEFTNLDEIQSIIAKEDLKPILVALFSKDEQNAQNYSDQINEAIKYLIHSNGAEESTSNSEKPTFDIIEKYVLAAIKFVNNSLNKEDDKQLIKNISNSVVSIAKDYLQNNFDISTIAKDLTKKQKQIINELIQKIFSLDEFNQLLESVITQSLASDSYENVTSITDFINKLVKNNLQAIKKLFNSSINNSLTDETIRNTLSEVFIELIKDKANVQINDQNEEDIKAILGRLLPHASKFNTLQNLINKVFEIFADHDILIEKLTLNQDTLNLVKDLFKDLNTVAEQVDKKDLRKILFAMFDINNNSQQAVNQVFETIKVFLNKSNSEPADSEQESQAVTYLKLIIPLAKIISNSVSSDNNEEDQKIITSLKDLSLRLIEWLVKDKFNVNNIDSLSQKQKDLINALIDPLLASQQISDFITDFLNRILTSDTFENTESYEQLINKAFNEFKESIIDKAKDFIKIELKDRNIQEKLKAVIIELINNRLTIENNEEINSVFDNLITRLFNFANESNIIDALLGSVKDTIKETDEIFKDNKIIFDYNVLIEKIVSDDSINKIFTKENVNLLLENIFGINQDSEVEVNDLFKLYKFALELQKENSSKQKSDSQDSRININLVNIVNKFANSLSLEKQTTNIVISHVQKLILKVYQDYLNNDAGLEKLIPSATVNQKQLVKDILNKTITNAKFNDLVNGIVKDFLITENYQADSFTQLVNKLISTNGEKIINFVKEFFKELLDDDSIKTQTSVALDELLESKINNPIDERTKQSIKNEIKKLLNALPQITVYQSILDEIKTLITENNVIGEDWNLNRTLIDKINEKLSSQEEIAKIIDTESLKAILQAIFDVNNIEKSNQDLINIYKWIRLQSQSTQPVENTEEGAETDGSQQDNKPKFNVLSLTLNILKSLNGSIDKGSAQQKQAIKSFVKEILKFEISQLQFTDSEFISSDIERKIKALLTSIVEVSSTDKLFDTLLIKFLDKTYDLSESNSINEWIKKLLTLAKDDLSNNLKELLNDLDTTLSIKSSIKEVVEDILENKSNQKLTDDQKQSISNVIDYVLGYTKETPLYLDIVKKIIDNLTEVDFVVDNALNKQAILNAIKKEVTFEKLKELVNKNNIQFLFNKLFSSNNSGKDFAVVYKLIRSIIKKQIESSISASAEEVAQNSTNIVDFALKTLKALNGSAPQETNSNNIADFVVDVTKFELSEDENSLINLNSPIVTNQTIHKLTKAAVQSDKWLNSFKTLISKYVKDEKSEYQSSETINDFIKNFIKTNKDELSTISIEILSSAFKKEEDAKSLAVDLFNYLNDTKSLQLNIQDPKSQAFVDYATNILTTFSSKTFIKDAIKKIIEQLGEMDFIEGETLQRNFIPELIKKIVKNIDWNVILTNELPEYVVEVLIPTEGLKTSDGQINQIQASQNTEKLYNLLEFVYKILISKSTPDSNDTEATTEDYDNDWYKKAEGIILKITKLFNNSISQSLEPEVRKTKAKILSDAFVKIAKKAISEIDLAALFDNQNIDKEKVNSFIKQISEYESVSKFVSELFTDFFTTDYKQWKEWKDKDDESIQKFLSLFIRHKKDSIKELIKNSINTFVSNKENRDNLVRQLFKYMNLEQTTQDDVDLVSNIINGILPKLLSHNWFENKVLNRAFWWLDKKALEFDLKNPTKWINDAFLKVKSGITPDDLTIILEWMGDEDGKVIKSQEFMKLINLFFGKSNFENSLLFNGLRNLNMDEDHSKRTSKKDLDAITGNNLIEVIKKATAKKESKPPADENPDYWVQAPGSVIDIISKGFELLAKAYNDAKISESYWMFAERRKRPEWQAIYRYLVMVEYAVFEMYFRETNANERENGFIGMMYSKIAIMWTILEDKASVINVNKFLGGKISNAKIRNEFVDYYNDYSWWKGYKYPDENTYKPDSIIYIISTSGYKDGDPEAKKVDLNINFAIDKAGTKLTKREYILKTIKAGGWAEFMNASNKQSGNVYSELSRVKPGKY